MSHPSLLPLCLVLSAGALAHSAQASQPVHPGAVRVVPALDGSSARQAAERGYMGIQIAGEPDGSAVVVRGVATGGPAWKAGIRTGDRILRLDGRAMRGARSIEEDFSTLRAGQRVRLVLSRDGWEREFTISLQPEGSFGSGGISIDPPTPLPGSLRRRNPWSVFTPGEGGSSGTQRVPAQPEPFFWRRGEAQPKELRDQLRAYFEEYDHFQTRHRQRLKVILEGAVRDSSRAAEAREPGTRSLIERPARDRDTSLRNELQDQVQSLRSEIQSLREALQRLGRDR